MLLGYLKGQGKNPIMIKHVLGKKLEMCLRSNRCVLGRFLTKVHVRGTMNVLKDLSGRLLLVRSEMRLIETKRLETVFLLSLLTPVSYTGLAA